MAVSNKRRVRRVVSRMGRPPWTLQEAQRWAFDFYPNMRQPRRAVLAQSLLEWRP